MTGSYHNYFRIFDVDKATDPDSPANIVLQADKSAFKAKKMGMRNGARPGGLKDQMNMETLDFNKKILHASWDPRENTIAVCSQSFLPWLLF